MQIIPLSLVEAGNSGFTHKMVITGTDVAGMTSAAATSVYPGFNGATTFPTGLAVLDAHWRVVTAFVFAPGTLVFSLGDGGDVARFIAASTDLKTAAYGAGAIAKYPFQYNVADTIDITITAGAGALTSVTAGELHLFLRLVNLAQLDK